MTVEAVGRDARINRRVMLASRQLSNSPPQLLCIWFTVDILELAFTATRDVLTVCIIDLCVCVCAYTASFICTEYCNKNSIHVMHFHNSHMWEFFWNVQEVFAIMLLWIPPVTDLGLVGFLIQVFPCKNHCHNHQFIIAPYFAFFLFMVKFEDTITIVIQLMHSLITVIILQCFWRGYWQFSACLWKLESLLFTSYGVSAAVDFDLVVRVKDGSPLMQH